MAGEMPIALSDELIICTLDRPAELSRCLESVARQTRLPSRIRVVDASGDETTRHLVESVEADLSSPIVYQKEKRGLTRQRNAGVRTGSSDIVHFVDDDTILDPGYLAAIMALFEADKEGEVLGVGGLITNLHRHDVSILKRLFLLDSRRAGRVLRSGRNPVVADLTEATDVDWLSGCSMSYRRVVFDEISFNEALAGYGLGEDSEFSYRLAQRGRLVVTPAARIEHLESPQNRLATPEYTYDELVNRARRVRARTGVLRMRWYWWSVGGQLLALAGAAWRGGPVERERLTQALAAVRAVLLREGVVRCDDGLPQTPS